MRRQETNEEQLVVAAPACGQMQKTVDSGAALERPKAERFMLTVWMGGTAGK